MDLLRPNPQAVIKAAQKRLLQAQAAQRLPRVAWAALDGEIPPLPAGRVLLVLPHGAAAPAGVQAVYLPRKLFTLLHPSRETRYRVASGGRGSGKSHSFATALLLRMLAGRIRVLCAREIMKSLRDSVHYLLSSKIEAMQLSEFFDITDRSIACTVTGAEVIFAGLWANVSQLRSLEDISLCWIEEGESVSAESLRILAPTIRGNDSEIWITLNPDNKDAPVQQFCNGTRPETLHEHVIFSDNPFFTKPLELERQYLQRVDDDAYRHVWLGECRTITNAQILAGKYVVESFEPQGGLWNGPYFGLDFGFSQDPTAAVRVWVHDRTLYIEHEVWQIGCDIDRTPALLDRIPNARQHVMRADNARPESISYLQKHGYPLVEAVEKWAGSVEDGVAHLRSYEKIVIHPRCTHAVEEARLYSYKVDKLTGNVLPDIVDKHNHIMDSLRYALSPLIKGNGADAFLQWLQAEVAKDGNYDKEVQNFKKQGIKITELTAPGNH